MVKIAIFAGHGGSDPGAIGVNGFYEKDLNLSVSNATTDLLRKWGYEVINNRTTDIDRSIEQDARLASESGVNAVIEIHQNSNPGTPATGSEAFISLRELPHARDLASSILQNLEKLGFANRGVKTLQNQSGQDNFAILRNTNAPAVLLETAFINNYSDMVRFDVDKIALAIANAVRDIFHSKLNESHHKPNCNGLPAYPGTLLELGSQSEYVRQAQHCLNCVGTYANIKEDGIFGTQTHASTIAFQKAFNLKPDGIIGPLTWAKLSKECTCTHATTIEATRITARETIGTLLLLSLFARRKFSR